MHCPNCSYQNTGGISRCNRCNFKLPQASAPAHQAPQHRLPCRNCRHENPAEAARCEQCNVKLHAAVSPAPAGLYNQPFTINRYAYGHEQ